MHLAHACDGRRGWWHRQRHGMVTPPGPGGAASARSGLANADAIRFVKTEVLRKYWFWGLVYVVAVLALGILRILAR